MNHRERYMSIKDISTTQHLNQHPSGKHQVGFPPLLFYQFCKRRLQKTIQSIFRASNKNKKIKNVKLSISIKCKFSLPQALLAYSVHLFSFCHCCRKVPFCPALRQKKPSTWGNLALTALCVPTICTPHQPPGAPPTSPCPSSPTGTPTHSA